MKKLMSIIILLLFVSMGISQTSQWKLTWDANPDSDNVHIYKVFKSNQPQADILAASINHPTTMYTDSVLTKGILYFYRLKATNYDEMESGFSEEVYAAIPDMYTIPPQTVRQGKNFGIINLTTFVNYPDTDILTWEVSQGTNITSSITNNILTISYPAQWTGQEKLYFKVYNEIGFNDIDSTLFTILPPLNPPTDIEFNFID